MENIVVRYAKNSDYDMAEIAGNVVGLLFFYLYHRENDTAVTRDVLFVDSWQSMKITADGVSGTHFLIM